MQWLQAHKGWALAAAGLLALGLGVWAFQALGKDRQLARVKELQKRLRGPETRNLDPQQRKQLFQQLRDEMKQLTPEQQRVLRKEQEQAFAKKISDFFALSAEEREAYLDRQIDRMEEGRKRWAERRQSGDGTRSGGKSGWDGWGGQKGVSPPTTPPNPGAGGPLSATQAKGKARDPAAREQRHKQRLEQTTAEQRAQFSEYFRLLNERRKQRGLAPFGRAGR